MDFSEQLLRALTDADGTSGHEEAVTKVMAGYLKGLANVSYDRLGSIIAEKKGTAAEPRILVDAHLDEVGFMVREITKSGFIKFLPLGGWWGHVALGQRMKIITARGVVAGVVGAKPPHLLKDEERKKVLDISDMFIDVGAAGKFDVGKKLGVKLGDPIVPDSTFAVMGNDQVYMAKAFDNRAACAAVIDLIKRLQKIRHPNTVYGSGSVQEEVGLRGANTVAHAVDPDIAVIVDVGLALDTPGCEDRPEKLGAGPSIFIFDALMLPNTRLRDLTIEVATKNKIPFNLTYMERGATDGGRIHLSRLGVPSIVIGPPTRYVHSHNSLMHRKDYDNTVKLVLELVKRLDKKTVASLTAR